MTVKEKIMEALEGAIKDASRPMATAFMQTPIEIYTDCEFDWDINLKFKDVNVLADMDLREGIKEFSDWPTIPQLYVKGEFVGGCDIVREMFKSGELHELLQSKGIEIETDGY